MLSLNKIGYYLSYISIVAILSLFSFSFFAGWAIIFVSWLIQANNWYDTLSKTSLLITVGLSILSLFVLANICLFMSENLAKNYFSKRLKDFKFSSNLLISLCAFVVFFAFVYFGFNSFIFYVSKWFWSIY
jgi:hypothetical protein